MGTFEVSQEQAFYLKRKGAFREALLAYAREYAESLRQENPFIAKVCFEEMVDVSLLQYLKEQRHFKDDKELLGSIRHDLIEALQRDYDDGKFDELLRYCRRKLIRKGRSKKPFSVDTSLLLPKNARSQRKVRDNSVLL